MRRKNGERSRNSNIPSVGNLEHDPHSLLLKLLPIAFPVFLDDGENDEAEGEQAKRVDERMGFVAHVEEEEREALDAEKHKREREGSEKFILRPAPESEEKERDDETAGHDAAGEELVERHQPHTENSLSEDRQFVRCHTVSQKRP